MRKAWMAAALALSTASPAAAQAGERWLLVRGDAARAGRLAYERMGELYLGAGTFRVVRADEAQADPATSRFVLGAAADNALVRALAPALGIELAPDALRYQGRRIPAGQGLVLLAPDPDGGGRVWLMTGVDEAGAIACLTTPMGAQREGWWQVETGRVVASGALPLSLDTARPSVVRLDRLARFLAAESAGAAADERALLVGRGLVGYAEVLAQLGYGDLVDYGRWLRGRGATEVERAEQAFAGRDLEAELRAAWALANERLGAGAGPAPAYHLLFAPADGTNARTFDADPATGRPRVLLNLCALTDGQRWRSALLHETVHTLQPPSEDPRLAARALREGVATALAQLLEPGLSDADALFWTEEELAAARAREDALLAAFRRDADSQDGARHAAWLVLGASPPLEGAPSRAGYYLAWRAASRWLAAHPGDPRALLTAPTDEVWEALR